MRLIDADELLERLRNAEAFYTHETAGDFDTGRALGLGEAREKVAEQPTIEAEPVKHGRWNINPDGYYPYCSECKEEPKSGKMTRFCQNCGARMDGDTNEES